jgi:hypothetical protein
MRLMTHPLPLRRRMASFSVLVAAAVALSIAPVAAQSDDGAPVAQPATPAAQGEQRDLYLDMPYSLGGFEPEIVMVRGDEHFAALDPGSEASAQTRSDLEAFLADVGGELKDMTSGYALASTDSFFAFVVGIRVPGAEAGRMLPAYLPILLGDLRDPSASEATVGGKDVTVVASLGEAEEVVDLYVYDAGDTLWLVQGPADVVEITLEDLP